MPNAPLISFCIPTFNRPLMLRALLERLVKEKGTLPIEIVVSDNCSGEATRELLEEYATNYGVRWQQNETNIGPTPNLIEALRLARGRYAWIFSDDDMLLPEALAKVVEVLRTHPALAYLFVARSLTDSALRPLTTSVQPCSLVEDLFFADGKAIFTACDGQMSDVLGYYSSTVVERLTFMRALAEHGAAKDSWFLARVLLSVVDGRECAILATAGVLTRIGNSSAGDDSRIWLDEGIDLYRYAVQLGYSRDFCTKKIVALFAGNSMKFVLNKAASKRTGNLRMVAEQAEVLSLLPRQGMWWCLSYLPKQVLLPLLWSRALRRLLVDALSKMRMRS